MLIVLTINLNSKVIPGAKRFSFAFHLQYGKNITPLYYADEPYLD